MQATASKMQYTLVRNEEGTSNLTVFVPGKKPLTALSTNPNWDAILKGVLSDDDSVLGLFDVSLMAAQKLEQLTERILVANGRLYFDGEEINDALAEQIVAFVAEGVEDWKPLALFYENIMANPSNNSREQAYRWLSSAKLTITDDGMIIGYKGVSKTNEKNVFMSTTAGNAISDGKAYKNAKIPNKLGKVVQMPRNEVVDDPNAACSVGLHIGTFDFAKSYGNTMLEVHINPRDVVSVPNGEGAKMRVCRYVPVKVIDKPYATALKPNVNVGGKTKPQVKATSKAAAKPADVRPVTVGDVYQDTDKRRGGRNFKVTAITDNVATAVGKSMPLNLTRQIATARLQSRKYKLVKKGR
jgi:hypothetical protein